jgi:hypothetical protein
VCTIVAGDVLILGYNFNVPLTTYPNTGSAGTSGWELTGTLSGTAGYPARERGVHYNGSGNGFIAVPTLIKAPTFSIHVWIMPKSLSEERTIFSTDRDVFTTDESFQQFALTLAKDGNLQVYLAKDIDSRDYVSVKNDGTIIVVNVWKYVVASVELQTSGANSDVNFFVDNVKSGSTEVQTGRFNVDLSSYKTYIGIQRKKAAASATAEYSDTRFDGFIQSFYFYQSAHVVGVTAHATAARCNALTAVPDALAACWTASFTQYYDGSENLSCNVASCDNKGCARAGVCQTCTGEPYCHLCRDKECEACTVYNACTASKCSTKGTEETGACTCGDGYKRKTGDIPYNEPCRACHTN